MPKKSSDTTNNKLRQALARRGLSRAPFVPKKGPVSKFGCETELGFFISGNIWMKQAAKLHENEDCILTVHLIPRPKPGYGGRYYLSNDARPCFGQVSFEVKDEVELRELLNSIL